MKTMSAGYDYLFKFLLIGDSGVGKSCMLLRFTDDKYSEDYISTIGVDFKMKSIELNGKHVKIQVWDTAGQERFRTITSSYYRGAQGVMIVYDVTNRESFEHVRAWLTEVERYCVTSVQVCLIGSKSDMFQREVTFEEGQMLADELDIPFIETSAKASTNVEEAFVLMTRRAQDRIAARTIIGHKASNIIKPGSTRKVQLTASRCC